MKYYFWFLPLVLLALLFQYAVLWPTAGRAWRGPWQAVWGTPTILVNPPATLSRDTAYDAHNTTVTASFASTDFLMPNTGIVSQYPTCKTPGEAYQNDAQGNIACVKPEAPQVKPGQRWRYIKRSGASDGSPWAPQQEELGSILHILDVKEGWVRYRWAGMDTETREPIASFLKTSRYVDDGETTQVKVSNGTMTDQNGTVARRDATTPAWGNLTGNLSADTTITLEPSSICMPGESLVVSPSKVMTCEKR